MKTQRNKKSKIEDQEKISRKKAIQKVGITALTAASIIFLSPAASPKGSTPKKPGRR